MEVKCHLRLRPKTETLFRNNELELGGRDGKMVQGESSTSEFKVISKESKYKNHKSRNEG